MAKLLPLCLWLLLALLARLMPHTPNFSAYASLIMLMGYQLTRANTLILTLVSLVISDIVLAALSPYPILGLWSIFTYSGFLAMAWAAHYLYQQPKLKRISMFGISANCAYWLWTNFGTWLTSTMYPHTGTGLLTCFVAGLPFLENSLISALIFLPIGFGMMILMERSWALKPH